MRRKAKLKDRVVGQLQVRQLFFGNTYRRNMDNKVGLTVLDTLVEFCGNRADSHASCGLKAMKQLRSSCFGAKLVKLFWLQAADDGSPGLHKTRSAA